MSARNSSIDRPDVTPTDGPRPAERRAAGERRRQGARRARPVAVLVSAMTLSGGLASAALANGSGARPASAAERHAIISALVAQDGSAGDIVGVYVSRSNANLAVACERTPERQLVSFVFVRRGGKWRVSAYGPARRTGNSTDRRLELACH
jgi:hypothetical protein